MVISHAIRIALIRFDGYVDFCFRYVVGAIYETERFGVPFVRRFKFGRRPTVFKLKNGNTQISNLHLVETLPDIVYLLDCLYKL